LGSARANALTPCIRSQRFLSPGWDARRLACCPLWPRLRYGGVTPFDLGKRRGSARVGSLVRRNLVGGVFRFSACSRLGLLPCSFIPPTPIEAPPLLSFRTLLHGATLPPPPSSTARST